MDTHATGTFSFTLSAEWDYVPTYNREAYLQNQYTIPLDERLDMRRVVEMLLRSGNWEPYDAVRSMTTEKYLEAERPSHKPLFSEYLYFNSHMRRLIYNQREFTKVTSDETDDKPEKSAQTAKTECEGMAADGVADQLSGQEQKIDNASEVARTQSSKSDIRKYRKYAKDVDVNGDPMVVLHHRHFDKNASYHLFRYCKYRNSGSEKKDAELIEYILPISSLELRLYAVGVMLLTIRCQNEEPKGPDDKTVLYKYHVYQLGKDNKTVKCATKNQDVVEASHLAWIESCGRRLFSARMCPGGCFSAMADEYPVLSYLECDEKSEKKQVTICDFRELLPITNVEIDKQGESKDQKLSLYNIIPVRTTQPEQLNIFSELICSQCISKTKLNQSIDVPSGALFVLDCFNDDRMYLHGSIVSEDIYNKTIHGWKQRHTDDGYLDLKDWYAILYADHDWRSPTLQDPYTLVSLIEQATDARWYASGTLHGMTYHSMLMLTPSVPYDFLQTNNDWHYLQMFLIAILQRCSIQRFYREASGLLRTKPWRSDVLRSSVQNRYTLFLNQFWFFEVTEQEQGKMLFSRLQQAMNVERDVQFLDSALEEINQQNADNLSNMVNKLLVPLSIMGGLWTIIEMWDRYFAKEPPDLLQQLKSVFVNNVTQQSLFTANDLFSLVFLFLMLVCIVKYIWNQVGYIRHSCKGLRMDLKRRLKKFFIPFGQR